MKILFLSPSFYPTIGGVEKHVYKLSEELLKKNIEITILSEHKLERRIGKKRDCQLYYPSDIRSENALYSDTSSKFKTNITNKFNIRLLSLGPDGWLKKFKIWYALWRNRKILLNSDLVHCHDVFFWYLPFRFLYPHIPVYTTFHGYETRVPPQRKAVVIRRLTRILSRKTICIGSYIEKWYGTKADLILYGGTDPSIQSTCNNDYKIGFRILLLGRLEKDNGIPVYIETLKILRQKKIDFTLEACGDGTYRRRLERFGKVHGFVDNPGSFLNRCNIVFASSYLSILEAFSMKKPVFSVFTNPLKKDYLKDTPFSKYMIIEDKPQALADKIIRMERNRTIYSVNVSKALQWVRSQTWTNIAEQYIRFWNT